MFRHLVMTFATRSEIRGKFWNVKCVWTSLGASSPLCCKQLGRGWGTSKHNCLVSYLLCWRRHFSATVGHLQVTKRYSFPPYSFPLYTFLWPEDNPEWPKHVVVSIINRIQDICVMTYPTPSIYNKYISTFCNSENIEITKTIHFYALQYEME